MSPDEPGATDPFVLLAELARRPEISRTVLELAIRAGKLTVITRHGHYWVLRKEAEEWLSWRAAAGASPNPIYQLEL